MTLRQVAWRHAALQRTGAGADHLVVDVAVAVALMVITLAGLASVGGSADTSRPRRSR